MRFFVRAANAHRSENRTAYILSLTLTAVFVAFAVGQLFSFEKFPDVTQTWLLPGGDPAAHLVAALLPTLEIFALPFLLFMRLSPLMRGVSMVCGWLAAVGWLMIALTLAGEPLVNIGFFGATIPLYAGWWAVIVSLLLCMAMALVSIDFFTSRHKRATSGLSL